MYHQKTKRHEKVCSINHDAICHVVWQLNAQKFALIDTEYIMKNIPAAQSANEQMQEATKKYQAEVEALG